MVGDSDSRPATLTITIQGADDKITIDGLSAQGPDLTVYEDDLADGSSPDAAALTQSGTFTVNGQDGIASITIEGVNAFVGQTFTTAHGVFTITGLLTLLLYGVEYVMLGFIESEFIPGVFTVPPGDDWRCGMAITLQP